MKIAIILVALISLVLYILFSKPNSSNRQGRNSSIYRSSIRNSYPSTEEVFNTIKEANIPPCFLGRSDDA